MVRFGTPNGIRTRAAALARPAEVEADGECRLEEADGLAGPAEPPALARPAQDDENRHRHSSGGEDGSSLLLRSVQVAWGSVWDRRLRLSSPAGRACAPPQRRSLPLAPLSKDRGACYAPGVTSPLSYARTTA